MRILVIGGGGREHAIVWKLAQSSRAEKLYCAPGNAGIARQAECINLQPSDLDGLANFAADQKIDLTVVGPEGPLAAGIVDRFEARGLPIFGPSADPARIESSKIFSKELMVQYGIPTAAYWHCDSPEQAHAAVRSHFSSASKPLVLKADGLAAGKGVIIAESEIAAHDTVNSLMIQRTFGASGDRIVIEEYLEGEEASIMAFTDGDTVIPMPPCQDHKRVFDGDLGPNTGGMGAYTPVPVVPPFLVQEVVDTILRPAVSAVRDLGIPYKGVLYAGVILTEQGLKTLEFNCRFGDPETQAILPLLDTDLVDIMEAVVNSELESVPVQWSREAAVCVAAASAGYPGDYEKGKSISGLDRAAYVEQCLIFHAGTRMEESQTLTDGGRVLSITGLGADLIEASARAYSCIKQIQFDGMHYRHDIASRALNRTV